MRLRREVSLGIGAILALQVLLSMLVIGLLTRMGPAIERILHENVRSEEAVEEMATLLASNPQSGPTPQSFDQALQRAKDNVTEDPEGPLLVTIEREQKAAFQGDTTAREKTLTALRELGHVNRDSMRRADIKAKRLGQAGAWAAAMLGALMLALGLVVYRRLRLRLEVPIEELRRTTQDVRAGNLQARCTITEGPLELKQIANDFNWLLDRWLKEVRDETGTHDDEREAEVRRVLAYLLDRDPMPVMVLDAAGTRVIANRAGMQIETPQTDIQGWTIEDVPGTSFRLAKRES